MALVFQIPASGRNVRLSSLKVWLYVALYGRIFLGTFGKLNYFAFKCPNHGLQIDYEHGYHGGRYYHECEKCKFRFLFDDLKEIS